MMSFRQHIIHILLSIMFFFPGIYHIEGSELTLDTLLHQRIINKEHAVLAAQIPTIDNESSAHLQSLTCLPSARSIQR